MASRSEDIRDMKEVIRTGVSKMILFFRKLVLRGKVREVKLCLKMPRGITKLLSSFSPIAIWKIKEKIKNLF